MAKWADYLISAVRYAETPTTKHISQVRVHINNENNAIENSSIWSREEVTTAINKGKTFFTITKNTNNIWNKGAQIEKIWLFNNWYIKTQKDTTQRDNLGELPEF